MPKQLISRFRAALKSVGKKGFLLALVFVFIFLTSLIFNYLNKAQINGAKEIAYLASQNYATLINQFRYLYSSTVVNSAQKLGIEFTHDFHINRKSLPLPSTLSFLLNEKINQSGVTNAFLYSPYPFTWRKESGGLKDDFAKSAWQAFNENPRMPFSRIEQVNSVLSIRYATADVLKPECVFCHNNYPNTPKNDWQSGDLIGVLEINTPLVLNKTIASNHFSQMKIMFSTGLIVTLIAFYLLLVKLNLHKNNLKRVSNHFEKVSNDHKNLEVSLVEAKEQTLVQKSKTEDALKQAHNAKNIKSLFLASISDELRTPINAVLGYTKIVKSSQNIQSEHLESLSIIEQSGENLLHLINEILDMSKLASGATKLNVTNFDIIELCNSTVEMFALKAAQKHLILRFSTDIKADSVIVNGDPLKLRQVIISLLNNALKFTDKGRVILKLQLREDSMFSFNVIDTGIGVHQQYQEAIFNSFYQSDDTADFAGIGLGLSITQQYLKLMQSDIQVISTPSIGSQFFFDICLPIQKRAQQALIHNDAQGNSTDPAKLSNVVLVVEDNPVDQSSLFQILKYNGVQVLHSRSVFDALGLLKIERANLAITDLTNPLIKSTELLQKVKQHYAHMPIVAVIDYSLKNNIKHYEHLGFDNILTKPFSQDYVISIIADYVNLDSTKNITPSENPQKTNEKNSGFELPVEFSALLIEQCELFLVQEVETLIERLSKKFPSNNEYFLQLQQFVNDYDLEGLTSFLKGDSDVK